MVDTLSSVELGGLLSLMAAIDDLPPEEQAFGTYQEEQPLILTISSGAGVCWTCITTITLLAHIFSFHYLKDSCTQT